MALPGDLDALSPTELKELVIALLGKVAALEQTVAAQRAEIARLKGLKGRPALKPSGMEKASEPKPLSPPKGRRGPVTPRVAVEDRILAAAVPPGSRFKGYADFFVQDLVLRACCIRYRRERWLTPDGQLIVAPLPGGVDGHFGPELRGGFVAPSGRDCGGFVLPSIIKGKSLCRGWSPSCGPLAWRSPRGRSCACSSMATSAFSMKLATCSAPGWRSPPGSGSMTPAPATRPRMGPARRSATIISLGSAPRPAKAG